MSLWDNVKKFAQPYSDDDYDEYDEDEEFDDYEEEKPARRQSRRAPAPAPAPAPMPEPEEEDDNYGFGPMTTTTAPVASAPAVSSSYSAPMLSVNKNTSKQEVVLFRPGSFNDITKAADDLCNNKAVVVNMEGVDTAMARGVGDFLSGSVYALQGTVTKIAQSAYLFCPNNMNVVGDLESLQVEAEQYI